MRRNAVWNPWGLAMMAWLVLAPARQTWAETLPSRVLDPQWVRLLPAPTAQLPKLDSHPHVPPTQVKPPSLLVETPPAPLPTVEVQVPKPPEPTPIMVESLAPTLPAVPKDTEVPDIEEEETAPPGSPCAPGSNLMAMAAAQGGCTAFFRWQVQILAGRSLPKMKENQQKFSRQYSNLLKGLELIIKKMEDNDEPLLPYRLRVLPLADGKAAREWCQQLKAHQKKPKTPGADCLVIRSRTSVPSPEASR
ncbi:MAG: hypothetical protein WCP34_05840 [Pseudomonadota bacterium]